MTLDELLQRGWSLDQIRRWATERISLWNRLQPLEGNRGWESFVAMATEQALDMARQADAIDLTQEHVDRELVRLFAQWKDKMEVRTLLHDAREANQEASRILTQLQQRLEKEPGNA